MARFKKKGMHRHTKYTMKSSNGQAKLNVDNLKLESDIQVEEKE
jgi:hypothetical protein